jgi:rubrerythrin
MGIFKQYVKAKLTEEMALRAIDDDKKLSDGDILRQAIIAELDAVSLYEQMARSTSNRELQKVLLDVAREEKVHVGEFEALLEKIDKEQKPSLDDGAEETEDTTG